MADVTSTFAAKDVGFTSTVNRMQRSLAGFQNGISGFAVKAAGLVTAFVGVQQSLAAFRSGLDTAGRLNDLSKTTGEAAGNLAMLERAFQNNGMAAEQVGVSLAKMSEFIVNLRSGSESASNAASAMGISLADLAGKSPVQQMQALMQAIAGINDPALRTATAVDVFGRSGRAVVPLASQFASEMSNARAELGSLVPILNESGASLDELGDKLTNSVGNKFQELTIGFAAGITGANDFVTALSRIDAAGFGKGIGDSLRVAFDAPLETAKAIGYTLLTGVKQVGNNLMNAFSTAVGFFQNLFSDGEYWSGIGQRVQAMFMESVNAFNKLLLSAVEGALLKPLSNLPGLLGDPFRAALETTQDIRASLESASEANAKNLAEGGAKIESAIERATANTEVITKDWFGVEQSAADAARHFLEAQQVSDEIRANSEKTAENFGKGSAVLSQALNDLRGFDLAPKAGPEQRPDWTRSTEPPPAPAPTPDAASNTGGRTSAPKPTTALDALRKAAETDARARADVFRIEAERNRRTSRVSELMDKGFFSTAAGQELRAERNAEKRAQDLMTRRSATDALFGADSPLKNMGELQQRFRQQNPFGRREDFDRFVSEQAKSETERARETSAPTTGAGAGAAPSSPESTLMQTVKQIYEVLTRSDGIHDRLPVRSLA
jgi:hypothetical protein